MIIEEKIDLIYEKASELGIPPQIIDITKTVDNKIVVEKATVFYPKFENKLKELVEYSKNII